MKTFGIYRNGTQQGTIQAKTKKEAKSEVFAHYGKDCFELHEEKAEDIELFDTDFVILDNKNEMVTFSSNGEIIITSDEDEISEGRKAGLNYVSCTSLNKKQQKLLRKNIFNFS
jgi:hypothetical protein